MPGIRRRPKILRQALSRGDLIRFAGGFGWLGTPPTEEEMREWYVKYRRELLSMGNRAPLGCLPFWAFEPGIPDELRTLPEPTDPRLFLLATEPMEPDEYDRIQAAREEWLRTHPVEV